MSNFNILFVVHEKNINGSSRSLLEFIENLPGNYNPVVLTSYKSGLLVDELKRRGVITLYAYYRNWRIRYNTTNLLKRIYIKFKYLTINLISMMQLPFICKKLKKYNFSIIHSNTSVIIEGALISKYLKIKHIWHMREFGEEDFNYEFLLSCKKSYKFMIKNTFKFIYISKAIKDKYSKYIPEEKGHVLYNYVYNPNSVLKKFEIGSVLKLLITGMVIEEKGQRDACNAIKILIEEGYKNINLYIAGAGKTEELKNYIHNLQLDQYIFVLGQVADMVKLRKEMDIELVCSGCEAFGRVTVEAMMAGNPVIGSNTGGTVELIQDGFNGFLYEQGNAEALANKIKVFYENRNNIKLFGTNAYDSVKYKYNVQLYISNLLKIYSLENIENEN